MNSTEEFLVQMAIVYLGMRIANDKALTPVQQAALQNAIVANQAAIAAFAK